MELPQTWRWLETYETAPSQQFPPALGSADHRSPLRETDRLLDHGRGSSGRPTRSEELTARFGAERQCVGDRFATPNSYAQLAFSPESHGEDLRLPNHPA